MSPMNRTMNEVCGVQAPEDLGHFGCDVTARCNGHFIEHEDNNLYLTGELRSGEVVNHPLMTWTRLALGDLVSLQLPGAGEYVGTVECRTSDGLIIWIRDALNDRRLFHFHDCQSVSLIN